MEGPENCPDLTSFLMTVSGAGIGLKCGGYSLADIGPGGMALGWRRHIWTMVEQRLNQHLEGATPET